MLPIKHVTFVGIADILRSGAIYLTKCIAYTPELTNINIYFSYPDQILEVFQIFDIIELMNSYD